MQLVFTMRQLYRSWALVVLSAVVLGSTIDGQTPWRKESGPRTLAEYDLAVRGKLSRTRPINPVEIVRMDNNGEILLACVEPKTREQLTSLGIRFLRSQVELLTDWGFLTYDRSRNTYSTAIYVYGPWKASAIRELVGSRATAVAADLDADLRALRAYLGKTGREKALFSVLYAYVLHGYSMSQFSDEIYVKPELSAEHPFWNGFSWAIYPIKSFPFEPMRFPIDGTDFYVVGGSGIPAPPGARWVGLAKDAAVDRRIDDPELAKAFAEFGVADEQGRLTIPIFENEWSVRLENMARRAYAATRELASSAPMGELLGMATQAQAEMFVHYEVRYSVLSALVEKGSVAMPVDVENVARNRPADVGNLVFLIISEKPKK